MVMGRLEFWKRIGFLSLLYPIYIIIYRSMIFYIDYVFQTYDIILNDLLDISFFGLLFIIGMIVMNMVNKDYDKVYEIFGMTAEDIELADSGIDIVSDHIVITFESFMEYQQYFYQFVYYVLLSGLVIYIFMLLYFRIWDIGLTGWHMFINLIPIVGQLIFIYWLVLPSDKYAFDGKIIKTLNKLFKVRRRDIEPDYNDNPNRGRQRDD